jgi:hypothetical protein
MLGNVNTPSTVALMRLIDTQSKKTICNWCLNYAEANILPIFEKHCPNDSRPRNALKAPRDYPGGKVKFAAQAAARACGQGSAVVHTLSHSIGLYFYGAAAIAYDRVGLNENAEVYA